MQQTETSGCFSSHGRYWCWASLTFVSVFVFHLVWIWQSIDITDEGLHLTDQWLVVSGSKHYQYGMIWLTDLAGGIWLKYFVNWHLIGARLGWALVMSATGTVAFAVLSRYFSPRAAFWGISAASLAYIYHSLMVINYNNFPALLLTGAAAALVLSQETGASRLPRTGLAASGGALLGLAVMARFPLIAALTLPLLLPVIQCLFARRIPSKPHWTNAAVSLVSALLAILACLLFLRVVDHLAEYGNTLYGAAIAGRHSPIHTPSRLTKRLLETLLSALVRGYKFLFLGTTAAVFIAFVFRRFNARWLAATAFGWIFFWLLYSQVTATIYHPRYTYAEVLPGICLAIGSVHLLWAALRGGGLTDHQINRHVLLAMAVLVSLLIPLGSHGGIQNSKFGLWLLLPTAFLLIPDLFESLTSRLRRFAVGAHDVRYYVLASMVAIGILGAHIRFINPTRDFRDRFRLNTGLEHKLLRGIYTTAGRAKSIKGLLEEMEKRIKPREVILAYNVIPLVYYITRTQPALGTPWPSAMDLRELEKRLNKLWEGGGPRHVVRAKVNMANRNWGTLAVPEGPAWYPKHKGLRILDRAVEQRGYREVWSNREFAILGLPASMVER